MAGRSPDAVGGFPSTHRSLLLAACAADAAQRREALDELLRLYLPALRAYLLVCRRLDPHRAEDLLQAFVARQLLERQLLLRFEPQRGRFRSFLLKSLQNFVFDRLKSEGPQLDLEQAEPAARDEAPVFELQWSRQLLHEALRRMEQDCIAEGKAARWELFHVRVILPTLTRRAEPSYHALVERFGFRSAEQACNALVTAKRQFERTLRALIGETEHLLHDEEIDAEIADLCAIARRCGSLAMDWDRALAAGSGSPADDAESSICQSNPSEVAGLLSVRGTAQGNWRTEELAEVLRHGLETSLSEYLALQPFPGLLPAYSADTPSEQHAVSTSLRELFHAPAPPLGLLIALKRHARQLLKPGVSDLPQEFHRFVYFVSIAAALVHHREGISKSETNVLRVGLEQMAEQAWIDDDTRGLLGEALRRLPGAKRD